MLREQIILWFLVLLSLGCQGELDRPSQKDINRHLCGQDAFTEQSYLRVLFADTRLGEGGWIKASILEDNEAHDITLTKDFCISRNTLSSFNKRSQLIVRGERDGIKQGFVKALYELETRHEIILEDFQEANYQLSCPTNKMSPSRIELPLVGTTTEKLRDGIFYRLEVKGADGLHESHSGRLWQNSLQLANPSLWGDGEYQFHFQVFDYLRSNEVVAEISCNYTLDQTPPILSLQGSVPNKIHDTTHVIWDSSGLYLQGSDDTQSVEVCFQQLDAPPTPEDHSAFMESLNDCPSVVRTDLLSPVMFDEGFYLVSYRGKDELGNQSAWASWKELSVSNQSTVEAIKRASQDHGLFDLSVPSNGLTASINALRLGKAYLELKNDYDRDELFFKALKATLEVNDMAIQLIDSIEEGGSAALAIAPDRQLLFRMTENTLNVLHVVTNERQEIPLPEELRNVYLKVSQNSRKLVIGGINMYAIYDLDQIDSPPLLYESKDFFQGFEISPSGRYLLLRSYMKGFKLLDLELGNVIEVPSSDGFTYNTGSFLDDETFAVSRPTHQANIEVWKLSPTPVRLAVHGIEDTPYSLAWRDRRLFVGGSSGVIYQFDGFVESSEKKLFSFVADSADKLEFINDFLVAHTLTNDIILIDEDGKSQKIDRAGAYDYDGFAVDSSGILYTIGELSINVWDLSYRESQTLPLQGQVKEYFEESGIIITYDKNLDLFFAYRLHDYSRISLGREFVFGDYDSSCFVSVNKEFQKFYFTFRSGRLERLAAPDPQGCVYREYVQQKFLRYTDNETTEIWMFDESNAPVQLISVSGYYTNIFGTLPVLVVEDWETLSYNYYRLSHPLLCQNKLPCNEVPEEETKLLFSSESEILADPSGLFGFTGSIGPHLSDVSGKVVFSSPIKSWDFSIHDVLEQRKTLFFSSRASLFLWPWEEESLIIRLSGDSSAVVDRLANSFLLDGSTGAKLIKLDVESQVREICQRLERYLLRNFESFEPEASFCSQYW
ncbi:hypothetical protein [Pseudobacteriovorax antillogorgiicola]|uniref:Uncharacterized protein n=1 Tax=Pseudobacteriovorax antillogorgiicola TaxID=1513793 RepID=A0A1Y6BKK3_9BACT|nr:hypothetical protein [Pseudobacteriovorax antillogorgiicola]TCS54716.1 hypothetical protein EDD56_106229 [Pseudobacteriovorax antillogorgiicola]SMF16069.1 hypothetical protein SAMN06296036_10614 [Pseudobacteriovorax antillogorgiicola]